MLIPWRSVADEEARLLPPGGAVDETHSPGTQQRRHVAKAASPAFSREAKRGPGCGVLDLPPRAAGRRAHRQRTSPQSPGDSVPCTVNLNAFPAK
jgi:hypothetical protein